MMIENFEDSLKLAKNIIIEDDKKNKETLKFQMIWHYTVLKASSSLACPTPGQSQSMERVQ